MNAVHLGSVPAKTRDSLVTSERPSGQNCSNSPGGAVLVNGVSRFSVVALTTSIKVAVCQAELHLDI